MKNLKFLYFSTADVILSVGILIITFDLTSREYLKSSGDS